MFSCQELKDNMVINIDHALEITESICQLINYKNLDELEFFSGTVTTTEVLAKWFHSMISKRLVDVFFGSLKVTLHESHIAKASYEARVTL